MSSTGAGPDPPHRQALGGERRVTLDLDDVRPVEILRAWHELENADAADIEGRLSSSREGAHIRGYVDASVFDPAAVESLRLRAGDHPRRVEMDRQHRHKPPQVLFARKGGREATDWRRNPYRLIDDLLRESERYDTDDPRGVIQT